MVTTIWFGKNYLLQYLIYEYIVTAPDHKGVGGPRVEFRFLRRGMLTMRRHGPIIRDRST